jgi:hypothetical protein
MFGTPLPAASSKFLHDFDAFNKREGQLASIAKQAERRDRFSIENMPRDMWEREIAAELEWQAGAEARRLERERVRLEKREQRTQARELALQPTDADRNSVSVCVMVIEYLLSLLSEDELSDPVFLLTEKGATTMSTELAVYERVSDPMAFIERIGTIIAKSRMFGCETVEQGQSLALISMTDGVSMLDLRRRYHLIAGDLTMRADFMRSELRRLGGDYDWIKDGDDGKEAVFWLKYLGREHQVSYTIEHAKAEGLVKAGSRWVKDPGSMLRARCTTKAIRMHASEVMSGFCSDEEMQAIVGGELAPGVPAANGNGGGGAKKSKAKPATAEVVSSPTATATTNSQEDVQDAEYTPVSSAAGGTNGSGSTPLADPPFNADADDNDPTDGPKMSAAVEPPNGNSSADQQARIKELWGILGTASETKDRTLLKRGCTSVRSLTADQATEIITALEKVLASKNAPAIDLNAKISEALAKEVRERVKVANQIKAETAAKMRQALGLAGLNSLDDLTEGDARSFLQALNTPATIIEFLTNGKWPSVGPKIAGGNQSPDAALKN